MLLRANASAVELNLTCQIAEVIICLMQQSNTRENLPTADIPLLNATGVSLGYGDGDRFTYAVRDVTVSFTEHGYYGVIGPSGSGKSSLLYILSGLKQPTEGRITFRGKSLSGLNDLERSRIRRNHFGFVFQQPYLLNFLTARENVLLAASQDDPNASSHVDSLMEELGILQLADRFPAHLSGGEKQRLVVARAMVNRPAIIFADEPTAALDHANGTAVIELLKRYRSQGAVIVVTHDHSMLNGADCVYRMMDGVIPAHQRNDADFDPLA